MRQKIRLGRMNILMAVKDKVLAALEQARGERLSGGRLAETLGVSRAAVHKAISTLRTASPSTACPARATASPAMTTA